LDDTNGHARYKKMKIVADITDWLKILNRPFQPPSCCQIIGSNTDNSEIALKNFHGLVKKDLIVGTTIERHTNSTVLLYHRLRQQQNDKGVKIKFS
jgi:hypothetical protein